MQTDQLVHYLDDPRSAEEWLRRFGVNNLARAHSNFLKLANGGITLTLLGNLCEQLLQCLPRCSDPDMALNNLERFFLASRNPLSLASLFERDNEALPILIQIISTSQHLSDVLIQDPESYDLLRITEGHPVASAVLIDEICSEIETLDDLDAVMLGIRRFKRRETLRIAFGDIVREHSLEIVTRQISYLADAICEAALRVAWRSLVKQRGIPWGSDKEPATFVVLGFGKLGGTELNYSSDVELMFLYDVDGKTDGERATSNADFFEQLAQGFSRLLQEPTELGIAYGLDLRLRPENNQGPNVTRVDRATDYYDTRGRTWERQALMKGRPIAGNHDLGQEFLNRLQPWVYRRYLNRADITGIKALKRRIERLAVRDANDLRDVKTGHGGLRDIEFVIQFLQLLHGGDLPEVRTGNTLEAIAALEQVGCLNMQERSRLEANYRFLRKIEHRLQILFDLKTHTLPEDETELTKLAHRTGYDNTHALSALQTFRENYESTTALNQKILNHLLHDAFRDDAEAEPEVDLILDPDPSQQFIEEVLSHYNFRDIQTAFRNFTALAQEKIPFLSTRRCRHFLASIAPNLLQAINATPDADATLADLSRVSESLGGKGVLWELFSFHPASLELYVRLCASSPYLTGILTSNPGMIDELMDSLLLDRLPTIAMLEGTLQDLCRGAEDIDPILHSFKAAQHLRVGVRDILAKGTIDETTRALADVAEVCLKQIASREFQRLEERYGEPTFRGSDGKQQKCELIVLALGKLGGREPNYHSDLDLIFLYDGEGQTLPRRTERKSERSTTNQHFFSELGQRLLKVVDRLGPYGRLYEVDTRLRLTGKSGALAVSIDEFAHYFAEEKVPLSERQALCKARPICGSEQGCQRIMEVIGHTLRNPPWKDAYIHEIAETRHRLEASASPRNLKRAPGGTVDIEFIVQMLQLRHGVESHKILRPGTLPALCSLNEEGFLDEDTFATLSKAYRYLRGVEARLRLMNTAARHDLPEDHTELAKLAYLLHEDSAASLENRSRKVTTEARRLYRCLFHSEQN
ncbi:MAG: bifunctional [glutamate--ammonia ligase]-adenylyl-L-tyrosine phosphorylase/[glutamate--ammonia-ligase] adenylyltransferase [Planctomycetaceae bacterium]|nr:bifunctional [glutamate--ammonia ligase]-adenylyl-L-tyrosine phosphorylase/[glutamate--ammonia-ligase] adenylyltransferase [Planctomycetaceae bacterium]